MAVSTFRRKCDRCGKEFDARAGQKFCSGPCRCFTYQNSPAGKLRRTERYRERCRVDPGYVERHREQQRESYRRKKAGLRPPAGSPCEVCGAAAELVWDHDHSTNCFRGWLCHSCNLSLGHAHDNPTTLRRLAEYLEQHAATNLRGSDPPDPLLSPAGDGGMSIPRPPNSHGRH